MTAPHAPAPPAARVLVVEDELLIAQDLHEVLAGLGYAVVGSARTAADAERLADALQPDLVFVDIVLKGPTDGITLAERLRARRALPLVFLTAHADAATVRRAAAVRPDGYLLKPFASADVFAAAEAALSHYGRPAAFAPDAPGDAPEDAARRVEALPPAVVQRVAEHVARHLAGPLPLAELAGLAGMSPFHFARRFKAATGDAPHAYVVARRMAEARHLLRETDWPVAEIALAVGFGSPSHFAQAFRRHVGATPSAYRDDHPAAHDLDSRRTIPPPPADGVP